MARARDCIVVYARLHELGPKRDSRIVARVSRLLRARLMPRGLAETFEFSCHQIGHDVVWLLPLDSVANLRQPSGHLHHAVLTVVETQGELIAQGASWRGVITTGPVYISGTWTHGPGVQRAQELLDFHGPFPRMVVDSRVLREIPRDPRLHAAHHYPDEEWGYIRKLLHEDSDGSYFVDHLRAIEDELDDPEIDYPEVLRTHGDAIVSALQACHEWPPHHPSQLRALGWMAKYHNDVVSESGLDDSLLISRQRFDLP